MTIFVTSDRVAITPDDIALAYLQRRARAITDPVHVPDIPPAYMLPGQPLNP